jgi:hypothetical protein
MNHQIRLAVLGTALVVLSGCAQKVKVLVPPRVDLGGYGTIGVVEFTSDTDRELHGFATQRFVQAMQSAQSGAPVLELGSAERVLKAIGHDELDFEAIRAIGEKYRVDTVLTGQLGVTEVKPRLQLSTALDALNVEARVEASLAVKLQDANSGATRWTRSAQGSKTVAQASVTKHGTKRLDASDPEDAYGGLVAWLVNQVTDDFRPHWTKR